MSRVLGRSGGVVILGVVVLGIVARSAPAEAVGPVFGMVGIARGDTLRLTVGTFPLNPCVAQIGFRTATGSVPQSAPDRTVDLTPGQAAVLDVSGEALDLGPGRRVQLQPLVVLLPASDGVSASACRTTVEVFDSSTGATRLTVAPQPDPGVPPLFGPVGIALGQTARLNVTAFSPAPCVAEIGIEPRPDPGPGAVVQSGPTKTVTLAPGQAAFVDVDAATLGLAAGARAPLEPLVVILPGPNGVSACVATVEVYTTATGRTRAILQPLPLD